MKRLLKLLTWVIILLVGLILLTGIVTQTTLFKSYLKDFTVEELNGLLEGDLSIGEIKGNLFSNLKIRNLILTNSSDTLLKLPEVDLSYNILALLNDEIRIHELKIIEPVISLEEDSTGIWNVSRLISNDVETDSIPSKTKKPFGFAISLQSFSLYNGSFYLGTNESSIPKRISQFNINLNGYYRSEEIRIILDSLSFQTNHPDFKLNKLAFDFTQNEDELHLKNFSIITNLNTVEANLIHHQTKISQANLVSEKLNLKEFEFILPDLKFKKNPDLQITTQYNKDSLNFEIDLQSEKENLTIYGLIENYWALIDSNKSIKTNFALNMILNDIRLENWIADLPAAHLTGNIDLNGSFTGLKDLESNVIGNFQDLRLSEYSADVLQIDATYHQEDISGNISLYSKMSDLNLQIKIENITDYPIYNGTLSFEHLNLGEILLSDSIKSDLNFKLHFQGENFIPPDNILSLKSEWSPSFFNDLTIDTLMTEIHITGTQYNIDTLNIQTSAGIFSSRGEGDFNSNHLIKYHFELDDLQNMGQLIGADSLDAQGFIAGLLYGNPDSLNSDMKICLQQVTYNDFFVDSLTGMAYVFRLDSSLTMDIDVMAEKIQAGAIKIESLELSSLYNSDQIYSKIMVQFDQNLSGSMTSLLHLDSVLSLSAPQIDFKLIDEFWEGKLDEITYNTNNNDIQFSGVTIECITSEDKQRVFAKGILSPTGPVDFKLQLEGIHPKTILSYLGMTSQIDGRINFNLDLTGTATEPLLNGNLRLEEGSVGSINYQGMNSWFDYADDRFNFDFSLNFNGEDSLTAEGHLPLHFSLADTLDIFDNQKSISLDIKSDDIPVGLFFQNLKSFPEVSGNLSGNFALTNTLADPNIQGYLQFKNGLLKSPYWGIDYKDINFRISALDDKFSLEECQIISSDGYLNASGEIQLDLNGSAGKIIYSNMNVLTDNFFLLKHRDFEILISSDIKYQMEEGKPTIGGYVDLKRSSFYLPTVMDRAGYVTDSAEEIKPVLIEAREKKLALNNLQKEKVSVQVQRDTIEVPGFLDLLEGELELRIDRNTWVRNQQLRVELGGNIKMNIDKGKYSLKGPVDIVRGQYDLFGRRFTVIQGKIDFQGTKNINPPIFLEAEYVYRTVGREKRSLVIKITGNLEYPIITFLENNNQISQDDALSIVLYGRKKDELSFGTQSNMAEIDGSKVAMGIVSNVVSDRLTRSFSDDLKLDVIEVNANDNWQSANFIVGKYITQDIFVTYKREFGQSEDNNLHPETISMEYEIRKNIFLQLIEGNPQVSGYDLLYRLDWD